MKIAIVGYYGYRNIGDDALLDQTLKLLTTAYPHAMVSILGAKGQGLPPHRWVNRFGWQGVQTWRQADLAVFGGGGLFQDHTSLKSLLYYIALVWLARGRVIMMGLGFGPLRTQLGTWLLKWTLPKAQWIGCRDAHSLQTLTQLLPPHTHHRLSLGADLAWGYLTTPLPPPPHWSPDVPLSIGWSLRPSERAGRPWAPVVTHLSTQRGATHYGLSCQPCDTPLLRDAGIEHGLDVAFPMISPIPHVMVAMRYHACLLAALHGMPFCALAYDDKVASLATELGQPVLDSRHCPPHALLPVLEDLLAHYDTYQTQLITHRSRLYARWGTTLHDLLRV